MLGSGVFFTPGELASVAEAPWQVYFFWGLCGLITLCGALTLAELTSLLPRAGASYHIIREGFGPFWAFLKIWIEMWVSGPGSVAGVAIVLGELMVRLLGGQTAINLLGIQWGERTQVVLTSIKVVGLLSLVVGSLFLASPAASWATESAAASGASFLGFIRLVGLGVAAVLFTYDGWVDVTHMSERASKAPAPRPGAGRLGRDPPLSGRQLRVPAGRSSRGDGCSPHHRGDDGGVRHLRTRGRPDPERPHHGFHPGGAWGPGHDPAPALLRGRLAIRRADGRQPVEPLFSGPLLGLVEERPRRLRAFFRRSSAPSTGS